MRDPWIALVLTLFLLTACADRMPEPPIEELELGAAPGARFPSLDVGPGGIYVSWIEPGDEERDPRVRMAVLDGSPAETIASDPDLFVNWADFPSIRVDRDGAVGAQWLRRAGEPSWAYGIRFSVRAADGSWTPEAIPHGRDHAGEHGFVSIVPARRGGFDVIWLDGREMGAGGPMQLRSAVWSDGTFGEQEILDPDVCSCCQTDMVGFEDRRFVVYRDHAPGEIRDISFVRFDGTRWSAPQDLSGDGWQIAACPVNGPAIGVHEAQLGVVWFTSARDEPRVWARLSADFGETFGGPLRIDDGDPIGRVDATMLDDGSLIAVWLERSDDVAAVRARRIRDGVAEAALTLGLTAQGRESGFPRIVGVGSSTWIAWTDTSRPSRVRVARVDWD